MLVTVKGRQIKVNDELANEFKEFYKEDIDENLVTRRD